MVTESNLALLIAVGILSLILVSSVGMLLLQLFTRNSQGKNKKERSGRIPPNQQFFLSRPESMTVVRQILTREPIVGCRWRITYDRTEEGRMQARLFGNPVGGEGSVDILLNMIFHKLEPFKTELEWSYVVMSGKESSADRVVDSSNAAFRAGLRSAQFHKSSPAEKLLSSVTSAPIIVPGQAAAPQAEGSTQTGTQPAAESVPADQGATTKSATEPANGNGHDQPPSNGNGGKSCFNCHKAIEEGFTFCIYCGASAS